MPVYYTLNLGFDVTNPTAVKLGEFDGPPTGSSIPPLLQSKVWLESDVPPSQAAQFTVAGGTEIEVKGGDFIFVRLYSSAANPLPGLLARSALVFGRKHNHQDFRTPFALSSGNAQTFFDSGLIAPNFNGSWLVELGQIANAPTEQGTLYKFGFVAGATASNSGTEYMFGHDPEMNVGMGVGDGSHRAAVSASSK